MQIDEILKLIKQERKEKIAALALTGQAGAGKTHISGKIKSNGIPYSIMDFDWFFKLSRKERSRWLEEGKSISVEEWRKRADQNAWWNFQKANETIRSIKYSTEKTIIKNAYNRNDNGELSGTFEITPKGNGLLVVEDVPTILLDDIDIFIYVHADDTVRKDRIASGRKGKSRPQSRRKMAHNPALRDENIFGQSCKNRLHNRQFRKRIALYVPRRTKTFVTKTKRKSSGASSNILLTGVQPGFFIVFLYSTDQFPRKNR